MTKIRFEGKSYDVRDEGCMGRECLRLHPIQVRGATGFGSRATGRMAYECAERYYRGCPNPKPDPDKALAKQRRREGCR